MREENESANGRIIVYDFNWDGEQVPAIFMLPRNKEQTAPAALLLHGFGLRKEIMAETLGAGLLSQGIASLTIDLPFHGERYAGAFMPPKSPFEMMDRWRSAQQECSHCLRFLAEHADVDPQRISLVGYSLGAFLGLKVAADASVVSAVVLAGGGDLPDYIPFAAMIRMLADPIKWAEKLKGRPLLMLHGKHDTIVPPELASRLFDGAGEPKQIFWYDSGHILPKEAMSDIACWLADRMRK